VSDDIRRHFRLLSDYNRAANSQMYQACEKVSPVRLVESSSAPYSTILGLLEHLIASDDVWLSRFEGETAAQLVEDAGGRSLAELRTARDEIDARIASFVDDLTTAALNRTFRYKNSKGERLSAPISLLLTHMFNHQTHHRAQVQVLLRAAGVSGVSLDLHRLIGRPESH